MSSSKQINKVIIEGELIRGSYSEASKNTYFATLKQERKTANYKWADMYSVYALSPISKTLAKIVENNPNCHVVIEGELRTHYSEKKKVSITSILVNKILDTTESRTPNTLSK